jgi:CYTH domain-containing protein
VSNRNREIERKYLLSALPPRARSAPALRIDQGYLPGLRINERVRRAVSDDGTRYYRTLKSGAGIERMEIEEPIDERFFATVWPLTLGHRIEKRRYLVPDGDVTWEIDEFLDREGLWLAEVELESVSQRVAIPEWLVEFVVREVTDDVSYTNHVLAK